MDDWESKGDETIAGSVDKIDYLEARMKVF